MFVRRKNQDKGIGCFTPCGSVPDAPGRKRGLLSRIVRFRKDEDGNSTIEFVFLFPMFLFIFLSSFEMGILMVRHVMLERGLDLAVRAVRIGTSDAVDVDELRTMICTGAGIIPNCTENVKVEMIRIDPLNWQAIPAQADCIDHDDPGAPVRNFSNGGMNDLMFLRVCALFKPMLPTGGIGFQIPKESGDYYALTSTSAFVMEPG